MTIVNKDKADKWFASVPRKGRKWSNTDSQAVKSLGVGQAYVTEQHECGNGVSCTVLNRLRAAANYNFGAGGYRTMHFKHKKLVIQRLK